MNDSTKSLNDAGENSELTPEQRKERRKASIRAWQQKNPDYQRKRREAIKNGTWAFRHPGYTQPSADAAPCSTEPPSAS